MRLITPSSLHYPITVTRLRCQQDEEVTQGAPLFDYRYETTVIEGTEDNPEGEPVKRTFYSTYESDQEGTLQRWLVAQGTIISRAGIPIADVEEVCRHEVQFQGMCANCGKDMTEVTYNTIQKNTARATISAAHSHAGLLVSPAEASRSDEEAKRRLTSSRKLSLVVDLDQTIIHATVDTTVAEWQNDPTNPNHDAVKDVRAFQLLDEAPGARGCWYYIKLRPGLFEFLDEIAKLYECHIYTMGTRAYAQNIAKIVDPQGKIFGDRILSRDESGSMTVKSLRRLFPVDTKMVVIIDDRGDVWNWSQNLIKVTVYDFFVGIGDINSSFLPKRPGIDDVPPPQPEPLPTNGNGEVNENKTNGETKQKPTRPTGTSPIEPQANGDVSTIDQLMSMGGTADESTVKEQTNEHNETIMAQLADRPLLQKQKILDAADETTTTPADSPQQNGHSETPPQHRHNLLRDNDNELHYLCQTLQSIHHKFYAEYDTRNSLPPSRVSELRPNTPRLQAPKSASDLTSLPNVTGIMATMKLEVLKGIHLVFSGVIPLGTPIASHDTAVWAKSFGAVIQENIDRRTTHLIAAPGRRTAKVRQASRRGIKIVSQRWLLDCLAQWQRVDEDPYRLYRELEDEPASPERSGKDDQISPFEEQPGALSSSEEEAALTESDAETPSNGLRVNTAAERGTDADDEAEDTETEKELRQYMPSLSREDSSPHEQTKEDWDEVNDELAEFLGSDAEDDGSASEAESTKSSTSKASTTPRDSSATGAKKRKRTDAAGSADESAEEGGSKLQVRKKKALGRTSSLNTVEGVTEGAVAVPAPSTERIEEVVEGEGEEGTDDDLEAALAAEMAREESEEEG
ncbi:putative NLI interacting factor-like phosphatase 1 [Elsinoe fawcettii]|nr:putative NLI interacting factor-like phosphatase 1 [Elsinoe fawcettii]